MEENENNINDINIKLENLSKKCEILETKNNEYEKRIKKNEDIPIEDIYKLRKLSAALLIKDKYIKSPLEMSKIFLERNININDTDELTKINIEKKKGNIYAELSDFQLRKLDKNDKEKFMKEFKEKYGILDEDIPEKELKFEIEYRKYDENEIIKIVLIRLGYI